VRGEKRDGRLGGARLALLVLAVLLLAFYWRNLVGIPGGRTFFWEDFLEQNYPYRAFEAIELRRGVFPFWNPYQFAGMPFVADVQAAAFYPLNAALALVAGPDSLSPVWVELEGVLHALLGGFFLFLLVRRTTRSDEAAILSAVAWALSGFFVVRMIHLNVLSVVVWTPLLLLFLQSACEDRSLSAAAWGGIALGLSLLGGSPQFSLYVLLLLGLFALVEVVRPAAGEARPGRRLAPFAYLALIGAIGFGIAAVQLLPTEELSELSVRSEMTYEKSSECSFGPASFPTLLIPHLYGRFQGSTAGDYSGPGRYYYYWELCAYTGVVVLLLAAIALLHLPRDRMVRFLLFVVLFGLLLGLGGYGPLHPFFYRFLPVYDRFRCPGRALFLSGFAVAFLAGIGAKRLEDAPASSKGKKWGLAAVVGFLFLGGSVGFLAARPAAALAGGATGTASEVALRSYALFLFFLAASSYVLLRWAFGGSGAPRRLRFFLLLLVAGELFASGFGFNDGGTDPIPYYRGQAGVLESYRKEAAGNLFRVKTRADEGLVLPRNAGTLNRLASADGYNQLKIRRYEDLQTPPGLSPARFLDLLGIRIFPAFDPSIRALRLARNDDCLPKAFFAGEAERVPDASSLLARLAAPDLDLRRTVLLEGRSGGESLGGRGDASVALWTENRIEVDVDASGPGYLVLNEIHFPAWRVTVDGEERPSLPAYHALRAVRVEGGKHRVVWSYRSTAFRTGLAISLASLVGAVLLLFVVGPRRGDSPLSVWRSLGEGSRS
jgi:hypothetical protein